MVYQWLNQDFYVNPINVLFRQKGNHYNFYSQIYVGIVTDLIVFPINFFLVFLFRKSKPKKQKPNHQNIPWHLSKKKKENPKDFRTLFEGPPALQSNDIKMYLPGAEEEWSTRYTLSRKPEGQKQTGIVKLLCHGRIRLPHFCVYLAWLILWLTVLCSATFVTFYGIMFGDYKVKQWITSTLTSLLMSIIFTQPFKVSIRN